MSKLKRKLFGLSGKKKPATTSGRGTTRQLRPDEVAAIQRNMAAGGTRTPGRGGDYPITLLGGARGRI